MADDSPENVDASRAVPHEIGEGLLDEEMGPSSAMAHLYRGEVHRMKFWRERLDRTTRWAVIVVAAIVTWAFSSPDNPHYVLLVGVATLGIFLTIEARRYRGYEIWRTRVRILQENVWSYGLDPSLGVDDPEWREKLGRDYRTPTLKISAEEAVAMVEEVSEISQTTAAESADVSAAAEEQASSITQVSANVESLTEQAEQLQALLAKFEVSAAPSPVESPSPTSRAGPDVALGDGGR